MTSTAGFGLSTHVLNTSTGLPAAEMLVGLHVRSGAIGSDQWTELHSTRTDTDGRARDLSQGALKAGDYRLHFATGAWFAQQGIDCFFPSVTIEFRVSDTQRHHHVPLLLSPFGYSTYRGS